MKVPQFMFMLGNRLSEKDFTAQLDIISRISTGMKD